jgi:hypothetical protein
VGWAAGEVVVIRVWPAGVVVGAAGASEVVSTPAGVVVGTATAVVWQTSQH